MQKSKQKEKYDFAVSLGGNCAAAHNLLYRKLRFCSFPFDWVYMKDEKPLIMLVDGFSSQFSKFLLKENLIKLDANPSHPDKIQYQDAYSGYVFANHFTKSIENGGYEEVKKTFDKRCDRLIYLLKNAKDVLLLLSLAAERNISPIFDLNNFLKNKYPNIKFNFKIIMFNCKSDSIEHIDNITILKFMRCENKDDYLETNKEWNFLDKVQIKKSFKCKLFLKRLVMGYLLGKKIYRERLRWKGL